MNEISTPNHLTEAIRQQEAHALAASERKAAHALDGYAGGWIEERPLDSVVRDLPSYRGQDLTQLVEALPSDQRRVLDLGSGDNAVALSQLAGMFDDGSLRGTGVTLPLADRNGVNTPSNVNVVRADVDDYLRSVAQLPESERPMVIYSEKMFRWVANPLLTLKHAYRALPVGGYLLVDEVYNGQMPILGDDDKPVDPKDLEAALRADGYDITLGTSKPDENGVVQAYSVAIRKAEEHPTLRLPIGYVTVEDLGLDLDDYPARWDTPFETVHPGTTVLYRFHEPPQHQA